MQTLLETAAPEIAEAIANVIIAVLTWWLGYNKGARERRKYPSRRS